MLQLSFPLKRSAWRWLFHGVGAALVVVIASTPGRAQDAIAEANEEYQAKIQPLLQKHCGECHLGGTAQAGVNLDSEATATEILRQGKKWEAVHRVLSESEMPPDEAPPLNDDDRAMLVEWLDQVLNTLRCSGPTNPGSATLRRLNRTEYRNTVRDFVGVDFPAAGDFPGDDVGYGFDNIGDLLTIPPILLEKYLSAAEEISNAAFVETSSLQIDKTFLGNDLDACDGAYPGGTMMVLSSNGTVATSTPLPIAGRYHIEVVATAHQAGDEPAKMQIVANDKPLETFEVKRPFGSEETHSVEAYLPEGEVSLGVAFINDFLDPKDERPVGNDRNLLVVSVRIRGPKGIDRTQLPESHRKLLTVLPDEATSEIGAARQLIPIWVRNAYRRPPQAEEVAQLLSIYEMAKSEGATFEGAMKLVLQALLVSPQFLFKVEQPLPEDGSIRILNDDERATALSYFLWSTMPDAELFQLADERRLSDPDVLRAQVERMLNDPKAGNLVDNFAQQWLQLRLLDHASPSPEQFPDFNDALRADMAQETLLCVRRVFAENKSVTDLLVDSQTYLNERLAGHYGVPGVTGAEFRRVDVAPLGRGGILTQASILTLTSHPMRTSPVKRGKWIMENLLGETPPPPDPAAMPLDEQHELTGTLRQRMEQHRKNPACASCHLRMDALGFALENYDPIGRWRDQDEGLTIDATAALADGTEFRGARALQDVLGGPQREAFVRCFTEKMLTFALGRGLDYQDTCLIDEIIRRAAQENYRVRTIITEIVLSDLFLQRQMRGVE